MSNQPDRPAIATCMLAACQALGCALCRWAIGAALLIAAILPPTAGHGEGPRVETAARLPLLVRAEQGDTPATIAQRYLNDASKAWMISEYNGLEAFSEGRAVLVPQGPFRPGGLTPDGYQTVPVLAYADIDESAKRGQTISQAVFNDQMRWLKTEGFTAITPSQLIDFMEFSGQLPRRSVLITWDTQSQAFHDLAAPILQASGFTATVFIVTAGVGRKGAMTWDQLKQLHDAGFTIGCRGRQGRSLTLRKEAQGDENYFKAIQSELQLAKNEIEAQLQAPCSLLAYPHGSTSKLVAATAAKLGFAAAFVRSAGDNPFFADRFAIHRTSIDSRMNLEQFGQALTTLITADLH